MTEEQIEAVGELAYHMDAIRGIYEAHGAVGADDPQYHLDEALKSILGAIVCPESINDETDCGEPS